MGEYSIANIMNLSTATPPLLLSDNTQSMNLTAAYMLSMQRALMQAQCFNGGGLQQNFLSNNYFNNQPIYGSSKI
jgi:hypothetical protein